MTYTTEQIREMLEKAEQAKPFTTECSYMEELRASAPSIIRQLVDEVERLEKDCERERMRLAACGTAALGYYDGQCHEDYKSASLSDTQRLWENYKRLQEENERLKVTHLWKHISELKEQLAKYERVVEIARRLPNYPESEPIFFELIESLKQLDRKEK